MFRIVIILFTIAGFTSCRDNQQERINKTGSDSTSTDSLSVLNDPKNNLNVQTTSFIEIDTSGILMFPVSIAESERDGGSFSYKEIPGNSHWNIIFLNNRTNEYHLLSDKKMLIKNYDYKFSGSEPLDITQKRQNIFYTIITDDHNKDKKLTEEDPRYLFVSDKAGYQFQQISPSNCDLQSWKFIRATNKIVLTARRDSDGNHKFDEYDEVVTFEIDIDKEKEPREVFSSDFKKQLKILFDRDWKRLKQ